MSDKSETQTEHCTICGHEIDEEEGERDASLGDWYCWVCAESASPGEVPL